MNPVGASLNNLLQCLPRVFSLHGPDGQVVMAFASNDPDSVARTLLDWERHYANGCIGIEWQHAFPINSLGKERL